ncbi:Serine_threonine-protein kinase PknD [Streptomyces sp. enrichment culture]
MGQDSGDTGTRTGERAGEPAGQPTRAADTGAVVTAPPAEPGAPEHAAPGREAGDGEPAAVQGPVVGATERAGESAVRDHEELAVEPEVGPKRETEREAERDAPSLVKTGRAGSAEPADAVPAGTAERKGAAEAAPEDGAVPADDARTSDPGADAAPKPAPAPGTDAPEAEPEEQAEAEPEAEPDAAPAAEPEPAVKSATPSGAKPAARSAGTPAEATDRPAARRAPVDADEAAARKRAGEIAGLTTPPPGRLLSGRYRLISIVGRGGMGTVWEATDEILGRQVAVKELRLTNGIDDGERKRLITRTLREAKAIATIRSRGVVTIYDVVDEGSRPWIVMELIEGRSLADLIREDGPMPPTRAAEIGLAILDVLRAAHDKGILHRDVKPSNVLIADEDGRIVLTDFGIAKVEGDPSITSTGMLVGAPSYISPERARGEALGPAADLWSLGALLYCCVEGRPPYDEGGAIATLSAVMNSPLKPPRQAGPLAEVITGLLAKAPRDRLDEPRTRELLTAALTADPAGSDDRTMVVGLRTAGAAPAAPPPPAPQGTPPYGAPVVGTGAANGRRRALIVAAALIAVLAVIGTTLILVRGDGHADGQGSGQDQEQPQDGSPGGEDAAGDEGQDGAGGDAGPGGDPDASDGGAAGQDPGQEPDPDAEQPPGGEQDGDPDAGGTSGPPGTQPENDGDGTLPENPQGYAELTDDDFRFRMSLPEGWRRTGIAGQNSGGIFSAPDGGPPKVQVDFNATPGDDAAGAWRSLEPAVRNNSTDYRRIDIQQVGWRGYPTVADWEFERTEGGKRVRILNRGFQVDPGRGYAIMITCAADAWDEEECRTLRETAFLTFSPLP